MVRQRWLWEIATNDGLARLYIDDGLNDEDVELFLQMVEIGAKILRRKLDRESLRSWAYLPGPPGAAIAEAMKAGK